MIRISNSFLGLSAALCLLVTGTTPVADAQAPETPQLYPALSALEERLTDRVKGSENAPVTFIEYASVACGHCANFHTNGYEAVERGVATHDVRYVFRPMITGEPNLAVAGFMLANCAQDERYFDVIDVLFDQQATIFEAMRNGEAQAAFDAAAARAGFMNSEQVEACLGNEDNLEQVRLDHAQAVQDGVPSTPYFIVNGDRLTATTGENGTVYMVDGEILSDAQGPIPASHSVEAINRIIALYKSRSEG